MADDLRRQLREVEQATVALDGVIAVRREYVSLLERVACASAPCMLAMIECREADLQQCTLISKPRRVVRLELAKVFDLPANCW